MFLLLTIAIPTYNRGYILDKTLLNLQNLLDLNSAYRSCVEVLISNNGSSDNTKEILSKYSFKYFNQNKNIGFDENILFLYKHANSEYILFLSDDDILLYNGFVCLMNKLTIKIYDLVLCNYYSTENGIKINAFEIFKEIPKESNFIKIANLTPFYFLSGFVIRKIKIVDNVKFLKGTYARQMDICLHILDGKSKYYIMDDFLVEFIQNKLGGGCNIGPYEYRIQAGFSKVIFKYRHKFSYHYKGVNIFLAYLSGIINLNKTDIDILKKFFILLNILIELFRNRTFFSIIDLFEVIFKKIKKSFY